MLRKSKILRCVAYCGPKVHETTSLAHLGLGCCRKTANIFHYIYAKSGDGNTNSRLILSFVRRTSKEELPKNKVVRIKVANQDSVGKEPHGGCLLHSPVGEMPSKCYWGGNATT